MSNTSIMFKYLVCQITLSILTFLLLHYFKIGSYQTNISIVIFFLLFTLFTCKIIYKSNKKLFISVKITLNLLLLFELFKFIEFKLGFLPLYSELPIISAVFSFLVIVIYVVMINVLCSVIYHFKIKNT
jgi:hypothetical protein